jgi:beta-1,4-mannosyl-glycoprotein beta-1,4-N-acetylglucosaminyltransferase
MKRHHLGVSIGLLSVAAVGFHIWNLVFFFGGGVCRARRRLVHFSEAGHCKGAPLVAHHSSGSQLDLAVSSSFARPVYDVVTLNDELLVLELRMRELASVVDFFVINEQPKTTTGRPKPMHFRMNMAAFAEFSGQIILVNETVPDHLSDPWAREYATRVLGLNTVRRFAPPDALILFADVDEIPSCWTVHALKHSPKFPLDTFLHLSMPFFYYSLRWRESGPFSNAKAFTMAYLERYADPEKLFFDLSAHHYKLCDAGWHCSYCLGVEGVQNKLISFAHTEFTGPPYTDPGHILECMRSGKDIFMRPGYAFTLNQDHFNLPSPLQTMPERFASFWPRVVDHGRVDVTGL